MHALTSNKTSMLVEAVVASRYRPKENALGNNFASITKPIPVPFEVHPSEQSRVSWDVYLKSARSSFQGK